MLVVVTVYHILFCTLPYLLYIPRNTLYALETNKYKTKTSDCRFSLNSFLIQSFFVPTLNQESKENILFCFEVNLQKSYVYVNSLHCCYFYLNQKLLAEHMKTNTVCEHF